MMNLLARGMANVILGQTIALIILLVLVIMVFFFYKEDHYHYTSEHFENAPPAPEHAAETPIEEAANSAVNAEEAEEEVEETESVADPEDGEDIDDELTVISEGAATSDENSDFIVRDGKTIRLNRSFTAKIIQSDEKVKDWYSQIKNELSAYKGMRARLSWKRESFFIGRACVAKLTVRGKTLCVYFAVDPAKYADTKYKVEDVSAVRANVNTPCLYRVKNARRAKYVAQIVADGLKDFEKLENPVNKNYAPAYETTEALVERGLIKYVEGKAFPQNLNK